MSSYVLDPAWHAERSRLDNLSALYDPGTTAVFEQLGLGRGWRCLDVGAGTGSVVKMMAERVGPGGEVLALDSDTRFLETLADDTITVLASDVTADPLPQGDYDLVHARLLLEHLPASRKVLSAMTGAARPGGWVVVEDLDWSTALAVDPPAAVHERVVAACRALFTTTSYDPEYGRKLPRLMREAGLTGIGIRAVSMPLPSDPLRGQPAWEQFIDQLAPRLLGRELLTEDDLDAFHALWRAGHCTGFGPLMVSAWGRRPAADG